MASYTLVLIMRHTLTSLSIHVNIIMQFKSPSEEISKPERITRANDMFWYWNFFSGWDIYHMHQLLLDLKLEGNPKNKNMFTNYKMGIVRNIVIVLFHIFCP